MEKTSICRASARPALTRRWCLTGLGGVVSGLALAGRAGAQGQFPDRSVTLILPFPPGAIVDNVGRKLAARLRDEWRQSVICDNRPGAGGNLAGGVVAKAPPDGYTLLLSQYDSMVIAKARGIPLGYDPVADLVPVSQIGLSTTLFLVNADSPHRSFQDFIAHAKANPGKLNFGSNGQGGSYHLGLEQIKALAGVDIVHVPFRGGAPSMLDLLAGRVDAIFASTSLGLPQLSAGKVKLLALGSGERSDLYPGTPTIAEAGYPGFDVSLGLGLFAPRDTPVSLVGKINADVNRLLVDPDMLGKLKEEGITATPGSPSQFQARFAADVDAVGQLVRRLNIKAE